MKTLNLRRQKKHQNAFTLIEIMVATVVMIVLTGLVIQITSEVLKVWNRSSGKLSANAEARIAMDLLTQDLETAVFRNNGLRWLEAETKEIASVAGYQPQTINLLLFSPALDRPLKDKDSKVIPGDICAVQYELVYQNPVSGGSSRAEDNMFALHRRVIDPSTTFNQIMGEGNQETFTSWDDAIVTPVVTTLSLDPYPAPEDSNNYLAGHVANFIVDFYVVDDEGDEVKVPSPIKFGGTAPTVGSSAPSLAFPLAYAEISLTILSDEGTKLLQNLDANRGGTGFDFGDGEGIVRQHGEVFTRRVNFLARPL
ncbi:MAG: prepilin-type N-terminal cleavage/methylation domain-containing protein [Puniceicoccaceae bacterium]|nr:prepilin-type N-terminal cleavage/methylation domain-containing protein [Puniceicoccaceae bacterium]